MILFFQSRICHNRKLKWKRVFSSQGIFTDQPVLWLSSAAVVKSNSFVIQKKNPKTILAQFTLSVMVIYSVLHVLSFSDVTTLYVICWDFMWYQLWNRKKKHGFCFFQIKVMPSLIQSYLTQCCTSAGWQHLSGVISIPCHKLSVVFRSGVWVIPFKHMNMFTSKPLHCSSDCMF